MPNDSLLQRLQEVFRLEYGSELRTPDAAKAAVWLAAFFEGVIGENRNTNDLKGVVSTTS